MSLDWDRVPSGTTAAVIEISGAGRDVIVKLETFNPAAISRHPLAAPGYQTLKFWMIDPAVVLQKIVVDLGGLRPSYLGPPESFYSNQLAHKTHE